MATRTELRIGIAGLLLALTIAPAAASVRERTALLTIQNTRPLQVRGRHFVPRERVRVVVSLPARSSRTVVAGSRGTFRVRFRRIYLSRCAPVAVRARGNRGSTAVLRIAPTCVPSDL